MKAAPETPDAAMLYSRAGCSPCFALRRSASRASRRSGLPLVVLDVDGDPDLARLYGNEVPVLVMPGGRSLRGRVSPAEVDAAFREATVSLRPPRPVAALAGRVVTWALRRWRRDRKETT
jgi:hypothetical protein